jgi:hypothetical protein
MNGPLVDNAHQKGRGEHRKKPVHALQLIWEQSGMCRQGNAS